MTPEKQKALEAAGFVVEDTPYDWLGLTDEERQLVELRVAASRAIRRLREVRGMTQQQLADRLKSSQSRVAKIEAGASNVSLDLTLKAFFAVGGALSDLETAGPKPAAPRPGKAAAGRPAGSPAAAPKNPAPARGRTGTRGM
jgi:DNA-binding XRE family transcriptional regulator